MADIFKDGILYMDEIHDTELFEDILKEQEKDRQDKIIKENIEKNKSEDEKKVDEMCKKIRECFSELTEKLNKMNDKEILFEEEHGIIKCSNGYGIKIKAEGEERIFSLIIPD